MPGYLPYLDSRSKPQATVPSGQTSARGTADAWALAKRAAAAKRIAENLAIVGV